MIEDLEADLNGNQKQTSNTDGVDLADGANVGDAITIAN